ncbi:MULTISPECIES: hypothetical protein [unclassified Arthrobacter]|uniref:hypothetical protein n=1 Tax=unclassified Arthrobacter TaxID=235627 RepID=UPI00159D5255|nr:MULTISPECIES: hypothetical protein [unclassified Arthrobacter]MCQ9163841.1 hypothetical protein [Arthrobacter sp. STN4]NVM99993.1 hypothetical protein [Arthrobacter sp. SDTb3-6]
MLIQLLLAALLAGALVLGVVLATAPRRLPAGGRPPGRAAARVDALAVWAAALVPSAVFLGWHDAGLAVLVPLGAVALWFLYRVAAPAPAPVAVPAPHAGAASPAGPVDGAAPGSGAGRGRALYHLIITVVATWAAVSLAGALGPHPAARQLGTLIQHVIAWIVLLLACVGWLLGAFATPGKASERPSRVLGVFEAFLVAALAVCFYALS